MRRPFYLRPPWNILFEISKLEKLTPWNVNIAYLLNSFLTEMERMGKVDFRASGVALDSSALIYLMKSKGEKLAHLDRVVQQPVLPAFSDLLPQFDAFLQEIEVQMDKLYAMLVEKVKGAGIIEFSKLAKDATRMEAIQMFILLLFLAQDGKVNLWQNEETLELYIAVGDLKLAGNQQPAE
jgi:chromatin segregation and condensation protein Rec8/ScpA/Scc1 (kleisin family)